MSVLGFRRAAVEVTGVISLFQLVRGGVLIASDREDFRSGSFSIVLRWLSPAQWGMLFLLASILSIVGVPGAWTIAHSSTWWTPLPLVFVALWWACGLLAAVVTGVAGGPTVFLSPLCEAVILAGAVAALVGTRERRERD